MSPLLLKPKTEQLLAQYIDDIVACDKINTLHCAALYGDALSLGESSGVPLQMVVVMANVNMFFLKQVRQVTQRYTKKGLVTPLFLTPEHLKSSADVFPIECADLCDRHQLLRGEDLLAHIVVDSSHLRSECEQKLKGHLIRLRQSFVETGCDAKALDRWMKESFLACLPVFQAMLRLAKGRAEAGATAEMLVVAVGQAYRVDVKVFDTLHRHWQKPQKYSLQELEDIFGNYVNAIQQLALAVDAWV